jgi:HAMP domain-containing protein
VATSKSSFIDQELSPKALQRLLSTLSRARGGDFNIRMTAEGDGVEREVADTVNELLSLLAEFTTELERVSDSVTQGELRARLPLDKANGAWGQQLRAVNNIVVVFGKHVAELRRVVKAIHGGDMTRPVNVGPEATHRGGDLARAAEETNALITHMGQITAEVSRVFAEVGLDGRLNAQCHISDASGSWGLLVGSVNAASSSLSEQVQDLCVTAQSLAAGNLSARATVTSRGDLQTLKLGLNTAAGDLAALCSELRRVAQEVVSEGKLAVELRHPNPRGEWQGAQDTVNRMLSCVAGTWRSVAEHAERVLEGDYSRSADGKTLGDLGAPGRVLDRLATQQDLTHAALTALVDGRFGEFEIRGESQRELTLSQLALRLKRDFFRAVRGSLFEAREQSATQQDFATAALSALTSAVGASAAAYYVVSHGQLVRSVNLGCEPHNGETNLTVGEGLLGRVAHEGKALLLDNLQERSLRVRTGLLEFTPSGLLIYPIKHEERVTAVLELVFLNDSAATALEMLDYLGTDFARGPLDGRGVMPEVARVRELEEELVIANARLERLGSDLQQNRERARAAAVAT